MPAQFHSLLVICTGNICRSPMAEAFLRKRLAGLRDVSVASAGIGALVGHSADEKAVAVMDERGVDIRTHRGRQFGLEVARGFDLLLVMETGHQRWIEKRYPVLKGRVRLLGRWLDVPEIADPVGQPIEVFRNARDHIDRAVDGWIEQIMGRK